MAHRAAHSECWQFSDLKRELVEEQEKILGHTHNFFLTTQITAVCPCMKVALDVLNQKHADLSEVLQQERQRAERCLHEVASPSLDQEDGPN